MSQKNAKKLRREYKKAMKIQAEKDTKELHRFLANKSFKYRFKLAMKILFNIKAKKK